MDMKNLDLIDPQLKERIRRMNCQALVESVHSARNSEEIQESLNSFETSEDESSISSGDSIMEDVLPIFNKKYDDEKVE